VHRAPDKLPGAKEQQESPRRRAREFVIQGLYQWQVGGQDEAAIQVQAESVAGFDKADGALYGTARRSATERDALKLDLQPHIDRNWDEVSPIERCVLLLGACELKLHPETPYRVIINEAIELAKTFGGTDGHKFVNGVLDKLAAVLRAAEMRKA
jgi:N utilization substance protein B